MYKNSKYLLLDNISGIINFCKTFYFDLLTHSTSLNICMLPKIKKIICTISLVYNLKKETDIKIIHALSILDFLLWKQAEINTLQQKYLRKTKNIIFVAQSTLTNKLDFYFFSFLIINIIKPIFKKRYLSMRMKVFHDGFLFYISDITPIGELPEYFKKGRYSVKISIYFTNYIFRKIIIFFLYYLGYKR